MNRNDFVRQMIDQATLANCGKNGDQLVRLTQSPALLFIVQFVGTVSEAVISDLDGKVQELRSRGKQACYCIMNGQDTARLLFAYGKQLPTALLDKAQIESIQLDSIATPTGGIGLQSVKHV